MSTRRHKRRRIDTDSDPVASEQSTATPLRRQSLRQRVQDGPNSGPSEGAPTEDLDLDAFAKEREIWDAFREEHYERAFPCLISLYLTILILHCRS